ncbi:MAG TPA: type II toxin-antitoxin system HicB family antitoxin, partial [Stellaceae bacterium]|nr:type II toxin-antitoxin system HicB family antitoxin [Stellaceae bacterium]
VYSALLEPEPEGGFTVTFPEIGFGATYGDTWDEALRQAEDMLEEAVLGMIAHNEDVPVPLPAKGRPVVRLPALTAAKLELYRAMRQAGLDEAQLAARLGWPRKRSPISSMVTTPSASNSSKPRSPRSAVGLW